MSEEKAMRYKDLERINESNECCYHKIRIQKYDEVLNNYLLSDDNDEAMICGPLGSHNSKYHMLVLTLPELLNLIVFKSEYVYITNLEVIKGEEGLEDYNVLRQLNFSFVKTADYYINKVKEVDESFYKMKLYMHVMQDNSEVVRNKKIKVVDLNDIIYIAENEGCNVVNLIIDKINTKLEKYYYPGLSSVEEHMVKNILRDELSDRLVGSCL